MHRAGHAGVTITLPPGWHSASARRLEWSGISLALPLSWDGRLLFRDRVGSWGVVFQAANFELPPNEGFEPPQQLPPGQEDSIKAMAGGDVLVTVISDEPEGEPAPTTIELDDLRFLPADAPRVPRGHTLAERSLCFESRCLRIEADFGGRMPAPTERKQVDDILASIAVEQSPSRAGANSDEPEDR